VIHYPRRFREAVRSHHQPEWQVTVLWGHNELFFPLYPTAGTVSKNAAQWPRVTATFQIPAGAYDGSPGPVLKDLLPFGVQAMVRYRSTPTAEWVVIAVMDIVKTSFSANTDKAFTLECADYSAQIEKDTLIGEHLADGGKKENGAKIIRSLVKRTLGDLVAFDIRFDGEPPHYDDSQPATGSPWQIIQDLVETSGHEAFFNNYGWEFNIRPIERHADPVETLNVGVRGVLTSYESSWERGYNKIAVIYTDKDWTAPDGAPKDAKAPKIVGVWTQSSGPNAPPRVSNNTYVVERENVSLPSKAAADKAAARLARRTEGISRVTTGSGIAMPWLEPGDPVTVRYLGDKREDGFVDSVEFDLAASSMNFTVRNPNYLED
jgi:hypothetical protein